MTGLVSLAVTVAAAVFGYGIARQFVRSRLRFVDAIRSPLAPVIGGAIAYLVALPAALLPIVTTFTAAVFAISAGFGTASGVKAIERGDWTSRQLR